MKATLVALHGGISMRTFQKLKEIFLSVFCLRLALRVTGRRPRNSLLREVLAAGLLTALRDATTPLGVPGSIGYFVLSLVVVRVVLRRRGIRAWLVVVVHRAMLEAAHRRRASAFNF